MPGKTRTDFRKIAELEKKIDDAFRGEVGFIAVKLIKDLLSRGVSPVEGKGRLASYKNAAKYPGLNRNKGKNLKRTTQPMTREALAKTTKKQSPVNLKLTGDMLKSLSFKVKQGRIWIGFFDTKEAIKAKALQDGTANMAARPILPTEPGQQFAQTIWREILKAVKEKIENLTKSEK
jgi:hypothetical protein